jgi:hypothetical protein
MPLHKRIGGFADYRFNGWLSELTSPLLVV